MVNKQNVNDSGRTLISSALIPTIHSQPFNRHYLYIFEWSEIYNWYYVHFKVGLIVVVHTPFQSTIANIN